jgi:hypothetical protein
VEKVSGDGQGGSGVGAGGPGEGWGGLGKERKVGKALRKGRGSEKV